MTEAKVLPDDDLPRVQLTGQDAGDELPRRLIGEGPIEREYAHLFDAERFEPFQSLFERAEQTRRAVGREDVGGVRIERDDRRHGVAGAFTVQVQQHVDDRLMTEVQTIEDTDRDDRITI